MATIEELKELYGLAKYREIITAVVDVMKLEVEDHIEDANIFLQVAWAHHQLGEYEKSIAMMETISRFYSSASEIGESARRGLAHGYLQQDGDIEKADKILQQLPVGLKRDNVRMNTFIMAVRKKVEFPVKDVMAIILNALQVVPYSTVAGHIINNGALVLHEARQQEAVKPYLSILPGLIEVAIGIYEATNTPKNHIAGAMFRASQIFEAANWPAGALLVIQESVVIWRELVISQGGERYQKNLEGALAQLEKLEKLNK